MCGRRASVWIGVWAMEHRYVSGGDYFLVENICAIHLYYTQHVLYRARLAFDTHRIESRSDNRWLV